MAQVLVEDLYSEVTFSQLSQVELGCRGLSRELLLVGIVGLALVFVEATCLGYLMAEAIWRRLIFILFPS